MWLQPARRQRAVLGPTHPRIKVSLDQLIERRSTTGHQSGAEQGVKHQQIIHRPAETDIKSHQCRKQHQESEPRLEKLGIDRRPAFLGWNCLTQYLRGDFHVVLAVGRRLRAEWFKSGM